ncbi:hypothetical protein QEH59_07100 [Coraliomargarita sp. SDUM461004]|uniref:DUF202 domain-containing protein n=1 Tax=Thalassobacterium sedimentorum TaxID=3041258 RepID=A0ABU1AK20_9BACT|nr:hypothetical protein [Coraliomargarita sp. SDUM461004]MDQ8194185.1 hypothetical protein [Coraliomargarita sp. SDUM461004]
MHQSSAIKNEAATILELCQGDLMAALKVAESQLNIVYTRAQVLMSLAGMVVTVTGFSGRLIAGSSFAAQCFLIAGLLLSLCSAAWVFRRVMRVQWITTLASEDKEHALEKAIYRRNRKTTAYTIGGTLLFIGLLLYAISIALMLTDPVTIAGPVR